MAIDDLTPEAIDALIETRHPVVGLRFPPRGLQPYHAWLIQSLHHLAESSMGHLRVVTDDASTATVRVMPGRLTLSGQVLDYPGEAVDLSLFNNDTVYLWLEDQAGVATIGTAAEAAGWPGGTHLKLAEVTLAAGSISAMLDRRIENVFQA